MAAELTVNPSILHTPEHDLESVFWVLLWVTLLYMSNTWNSSSFSSTVNDIMNPKVYSGRGGPVKQHFIRDKYSMLNLKTPNSTGMETLLKDIHKVFCERYSEKARSLSKENERSDSDVSTDESADESVDQSVDQSTDQSADQSMDVSAADQSKDESAAQSTADQSKDESADESADEIGIATASATQTTQSGNHAELKSLHVTLVEIINNALKNKSNWASKDVAKRRAVKMPQDTESAARSGSKRSRDMVEKKSGSFIKLPPAKRSRSSRS